MACSTPEARTATEPPRGPERRTATTRLNILAVVLTVASHCRCSAAPPSLLAEARMLVFSLRGAETTATFRATVAGRSITNPGIAALLGTKKRATTTVQCSLCWFAEKSERYK